jgi:hypothetical protein
MIIIEEEGSSLSTKLKAAFLLTLPGVTGRSGGGASAFLLPLPARAALRSLLPIIIKEEGSSSLYKESSILLTCGGGAGWSSRSSSFTPLASRQDPPARVPRGGPLLTSSVGERRNTWVKSESANTSKISVVEIIIVERADVTKKNVFKRKRFQFTSVLDQMLA